VNQNESPPRNQSLLQQIGGTNPFKDTLAPRIFEIGTTFDRDVEAISQDRRLSQEGKRDKAKQRVQEALRALDDVQKPIEDYRKQTESMRSGMKTPSYDKADNYAAGLRRELRDRSVAMSFGQRAALMSGPTRDPSFIDALLELPAWASGFDMHNPNEAELYEGAKQSRLRDLNGALMDALDARAGVEREVMMVLNIIKNDVTSAAADLASRAA
jgi:hypothetical protein